MKKKVITGPNEGYTLPLSSEKGEKFVDFNQVLERIINRKKVKIIKKKRVTILERRDDTS